MRRRMKRRMKKTMQLYEKGKRRRGADDYEGEMRKKETQTTRGKERSEGEK